MPDPINTDTLLDLYERMFTIRQFEERAITEFKAGTLPGFIHASVGQEAIPVGVCAHLTTEDAITSTHRGHGHLIAKGGDIGGMFAELYGKETGLCRGRGGSMHIMDRAVGILGANGIVGGGIPIASGAALAFQLQGSDQVVVSFFGDGAVNIGSFHEALNLAGLWQLPVIFVCENNQYAESTPLAQALPIENLEPRARSYGFDGIVVDGNSLDDVYAVAREAVALARSGGGPTLIQANTYRWYGHHTGDVAPYRTEDEVNDWKRRDPLARVKERLVDVGLEGDVSEREDRVHEIIEDAVAAALAAPDPDPDAVLDYVFADLVGGGA
jgi:acetoin:2,6-dichlorophenolindophenol oxidoreductase subunit alpha